MNENNSSIKPSYRELEIELRKAKERILLLDSLIKTYESMIERLAALQPPAPILLKVDDPEALIKILKGNISQGRDAESDDKSADARNSGVTSQDGVK